MDGSPYSLSILTRYAVPTLVGAYTLTLPKIGGSTGPRNGDWIDIADADSNAGTNHITVNAASGDNVLYQGSVNPTAVINQSGTYTTAIVENGQWNMISSLNADTTFATQLPVEKDGTEILVADSMNFTGAGVTVSVGADGLAIVDIPGGAVGASFPVQDGGVEVLVASTLNFTGTGVTVTDAGSGVADINITGGGGGGGGDYVKLDEFIADGTSPVMEITGIDQTYTDLILIVSAATTNNGGAEVSFKLTVDAYNGTVYDSQYVAGGSNVGFNPQAASGDTTGMANVPCGYAVGPDGQTPPFFNTAEFTVYDYANVDTAKQYMGQFKRPHGTSGGSNTIQGTIWHQGGVFNYGGGAGTMNVGAVSARVSAGNFAIGSKLRIYGRK